MRRATVAAALVALVTLVANAARAPEDSALATIDLATREGTARVR